MQVYIIVYKSLYNTYLQRHKEHSFGIIFFQHNVN